MLWRGVETGVVDVVEGASFLAGNGIVAACARVGRESCMSRGAVSA